jgi:hypothetical protein
MIATFSFTYFLERETPDSLMRENKKSGTPVLAELKSRLFEDDGDVLGVGGQFDSTLKALVVVGGRSSIIQALHAQGEYLKIKTRRGRGDLLLYTYRKMNLFGKNKTMVAITGEHSAILSQEFGPPVQVLGPDKGVTPRELADLLQTVFFPAN